MNVKASGTIRQFRTGGMYTILPSDKDMKKQPVDLSTIEAMETFVVKWHNNSVVNLASNFETHLPVRSVGQRVKGQSNTCVSQLNLVKSYNEGMGGVDVMDRLLRSYRLVFFIISCFIVSITSFAFSLYLMLYHTCY